MAQWSDFVVGRAIDRQALERLEEGHAQIGIDQLDREPPVSGRFGDNIGSDIRGDELRDRLPADAGATLAPDDRA